MATFYKIINILIRRQVYENHKYELLQTFLILFVKESTHDTMLWYKGKNFISLRILTPGVVR